MKCKVRTCPHDERWRLCAGRLGHQGRACCAPSYSARVLRCPSLPWPKKALLPSQCVFPVVHCLSRTPLHVCNYAAAPPTLRPRLCWGSGQPKGLLSLPSLSNAHPSPSLPPANSALRGTLLRRSDGGRLLAPSALRPSEDSHRTPPPPPASGASTFFASHSSGATTKQTHQARGRTAARHGSLACVRAPGNVVE